MFDQLMSTTKEKSSEGSREVVRFPTSIETFPFHLSVVIIQRLEILETFQRGSNQSHIECAKGSGIPVIEFNSMLNNILVNK